jgi:hypothetical protein
LYDTRTLPQQTAPGKHPWTFAPGIIIRENVKRKHPENQSVFPDLSFGPAFLGFGNGS